jgi:hypothetical protein
LRRNRVKERTKSGFDSGDGVNLVILTGVTSTPEQHDPDWPRYPETILTFSTNPPGLDKPFAVLTAFDPRGQDLSVAENEKRRRALDARLTTSGYKFVSVDACSPDRTHCECSVAVKMPQEKAIALARELEQVAIFWFDGKRFWIIGALVEADPLMLPRNV